MVTGVSVAVLKDFVATIYVDTVVIIAIPAAAIAVIITITIVIATAIATAIAIAIIIAIAIAIAIIIAIAIAIATPIAPAGHRGRHRGRCCGGGARGRGYSLAPDGFQPALDIYQRPRLLLVTPPDWRRPTLNVDGPLFRSLP